jgi:hypothetical protein
LCRACREEEAQRKEESRRVHMEGLKKKGSRR